MSQPGLSAGEPVISALASILEYSGQFSTQLLFHFFRDLLAQHLAIVQRLYNQYIYRSLPVLFTLSLM